MSLADNARLKPNMFLSSADQTNLYTACFVAAERYDEHVVEFAALIAAEAGHTGPDAANRRVGYARLRDQFERQAKEIRALASRINDVDAE